MSKDEKVSAEQVVRDIRRETRRKMFPYEKVEQGGIKLLAKNLTPNHIEALLSNQAGHLAITLRNLIYDVPHKSDSKIA